MANVNTAGETPSRGIAALHGEDHHRQQAVSGPASTLFAPGMSVCVVCCATTATSLDTVHDLVKALSPLVQVQTLVLSEEAELLEDRFEVIAVTPGTKLAKLRHVADLVNTDLICICDPDLMVEATGCRAVLQRAMTEVAAGNDVVAFGLVEGQVDGTLLSHVIAIDKWMSHRVLRKYLWALRIGLSLPGQFLILSPRMLRQLDREVDSYLDDLYLGWLARKHGVRVHRVPVVVGSEAPRKSWGSLLTQRVRWMRGLGSLFGHLRASPTAIGLLVVHSFAYHVMPILWMVGLVTLAITTPLVALSMWFCLSWLLACVSRQSLFAALGFLTVFPVVHLLSTLMWWVPASRATLTRR